MKKRIMYVLGIGIAVGASILGIFLYNAPTPNTGESTQHQGEINVITITIDGGETFANIPVAAQDTVLDVLNQLHEANEHVDLVTKEYAGIGVLVQSMYGRENGTDNKYWQYTINGIMPQVGADKAKVKAGDSILWQFGEFSS